MQRSTFLQFKTTVILSAYLFAGEFFPPAPAAEISAATSVAKLPRTAEQIDVEIARIEKDLAEARQRLLNTKTNVPVVCLRATREEVIEQDQYLRQMVIALDQNGRYLRRLIEVRRLNSERARERQAWTGFAQPPTASTAEGLIDLLSSARLEFRTSQMLLSILEAEITRLAATLIEDRKQLRLASDIVEDRTVQDLRRKWLIQFSQLKTDADEAAITAAEVGRLVTCEAIDGLRAHIEFLERQLSAARDQAKITGADATAILAQINEKREALQQELEAAISADIEIRNALTQPAGRIPDEAERFRAETSLQKVELLRGFIQLTDYAQTVWEDRLWASEQRPLRDLRKKQKHHAETRESLGKWKVLIEQMLAAVSEQLLKQNLRAANPNLTDAERDLANQLCATLQERAAINLRAVGALLFTEDLTARLHAELAEQISNVSLTGHLAALSQNTLQLLHRVWDAELYIAEDSTIVNGQKISIPRSITLGKVLIALTIFSIGLVAARLVYRAAKKLRLLGALGGGNDFELTARGLTGVIATLSLFIAMASVRIPWTVFAFMGGALAIGVGFGAQTLINNFISGVILLCERSIRVGDIVQVDDQRGKIMRVGFRNSLMARGDGIEALIPNSQFLEKKVINWTLSDDLVRHEFSIRVAHRSAPVTVTELIERAIGEHPHILKNPSAEVLLSDFDENGLVFTLHFWMRLTPGIDGGTVRSDIRTRIYELFNQAGIQMPFTQRDVHLDLAHPIQLKIARDGSCATSRHHRPSNMSAKAFSIAPNAAVEARRS